MFHFRHRPSLIDFKGDFREMNLCPRKSNHVSQCGVCLMTTENHALLRKTYEGCHWLQRDSGEPLEGVCVFRECLKDGAHSLIELRSLPGLPRGNVGTPTAHFLAEVNRCALPASLISKLGLRLSKNISQERLFSNVPMNYNNPRKKIYVSQTAHDLQLMGDEEYECHMLNKSIMNEEDECFIDESDDVEEWDRFESLHDDAHDLEKSKKCMLEFEREEEVTWEKGGSGRVWYTDAAFWREEEKEDDKFDEEGYWDFDVDLKDPLEEAINHRKISEMIDEAEYKEQLKQRKKRIRDLYSCKTKDMCKAAVKVNKNSKKIVLKCWRENMNISDTAVRLMKKFGWENNQSLGAIPNKMINSYSNNVTNNLLSQYKRKEGLRSEEERLSKNQSKDKIPFIFYGRDKNVPLSFFVRFIKSSNN